MRKFKLKQYSWTYYSRHTDEHEQHLIRSNLGRLMIHVRGSQLWHLALLVLTFAGLFDSVKSKRCGHLRINRVYGSQNSFNKLKYNPFVLLRIIWICLHGFFIFSLV